jgi:DmsE family decaheme c-type cytochrome
MNRTEPTPIMRISSASVVVAAALILAVPPPAAAQSQPAPKATSVAQATYVGSDVCGACHDDEAGWLSGSVHSEKATGGSPVKGGCESCHGPGSLHVDEPSKDNILTFSTEPAGRRSDACLSCHAIKTGLRDFYRTGHRINQVACDQCHARGASRAFHSMRTLQQPDVRVGAAVCESCHTDKRNEFSMPFHHRVHEGLLACADCHRQHTGFRTGRRRAEQEDLTCVRCHSQRQGPFVFPHMPMRVGGCATCHRPHGSTNPRLLVRSNMRTLCLECHTDTPRLHDLSQPRYQNCTVCHREIHGSNSSRLFLD